MTTLVPMTESDYAAYVEGSISDYAADKVAAGLWSQEQSLELARKTSDELLPHGLATPDQFLYCILDLAHDIDVGILWIAAQERAGRRIAYVYDVSVKPEHQRKGHATRAFVALEAEVCRLGLTGIALNVFGHNAGAQALYLKLGYRPTNIKMFKRMGETGR